MIYILLALFLDSVEKLSMKLKVSEPLIRFAVAIKDTKSRQQGRNEKT